MCKNTISLQCNNIIEMKRIYLLLSAVTIMGCGSNEQVREKLPTRVTTETVEVTQNASQRVYTGIVEENQAVSVSFTNMGVVKTVAVNEGQQVTKGQLIAQIDDTQAQNLLAASKAAAAQADDALERYKMLHDKGSMAEVQWVEVVSKTAQAKSQLEAAQKNLQDTRLTAPSGGIIGKKFIGAGETALPSQPVVTILDINTVKIKVSVPEKEISNIAPDTKTDIKVDAAGVSAKGGKIEKGILADALTHTYDVRINVANSNHKLLPGMAAEVNFLLSTQNNTTESVITLPVTAVQKRFDGTYFVWRVLGNGTVERAQVSTGSLIGNRIVVASGVNNGDIIVTEGYQKLSEGTKVVY